VKEWLKSVLNYRSYAKKTGGPFFGPPCRKRANLESLGESLVGNDQHLAVDEAGSYLLVHHVDVGLIARVQTQRVKPSSALNQQIEIFGVSQCVLHNVVKVSRRVLGKVFHRF